MVTVPLKERDERKSGPLHRQSSQISSIADRSFHRGESEIPKEVGKLLRKLVTQKLQ